MSEVIVITSGKGGVGKTTTTANLGVGLAIRGKKVVLIDTDTGLRNLDLLLGLERRIVYTLVDVVQKRVNYGQALVRHKKYTNLFLLPTSQVADKTAIEPEQMLELVEAMKSEFDYILIDCPAGIEQGYETAVIGADWAIVVTNPEISAVRDGANRTQAADIALIQALLGHIKHHHRGVVERLARIRQTGACPWLNRRILRQGMHIAILSGASVGRIFPSRNWRRSLFGSV